MSVPFFSVTNLRFKKDMVVESDVRTVKAKGSRLSDTDVEMANLCFGSSILSGSKLSSDLNRQAMDRKGPFSKPRVLINSATGKKFIQYDLDDPDSYYPKPAHVPAKSGPQKFPGAEPYDLNGDGSADCDSELHYVERLDLPTITSPRSTRDAASGQIDVAIMYEKIDKHILTAVYHKESDYNKTYQVKEYGPTIHKPSQPVHMPAPNALHAGEFEWFKNELMRNLMRRWSYRSTKPRHWRDICWQLETGKAYYIDSLQLVNMNGTVLYTLMPGNLSHTVRELAGKDGLGSVKYAIKLTVAEHRGPTKSTRKTWEAYERHGH